LKGIEADGVERRHSRTSTTRLTNVVSADTVLLVGSWFQTSSIWYLGKDRPITNMRETLGVSNQRRHRSRLKTRRIRPGKSKAPRRVSSG
jgi:hypothetical protein